MASYVMAIDIGTTGTKAIVFDTKGGIVGIGTFDTPTYFPAPGRVEQNPTEVVSLLYTATKAALDDSGVDPADIVGISFSHMCCSFLCVDREGNYLTNMILWNDFRGEERCISTPDSKVQVWVIPTNEELLIARDTKEIVSKL